MAHIPHHDTAEAGKCLAVGNDVGECGARLVAGASGALVGWDAEEDLDVLVGRGLLSPGVPGVEVKVVLSGRALDVGLETAVVIVELHPNEIEGDGIVKHGSVSSIWIGTLGSCTEVVRLAGIGIHE